MNTLVITNSSPCSASGGYDLRVFALCRFIEGAKHLLVVPLTVVDPKRSSLDVDSVFDSMEQLPSPYAGAPSLKRHLRLSNARFFEAAYPRAFASAVDRIRQIIETRRVERVVVFGANLAGLARATGFPRIVLDVCDSPSLTLSRYYAHQRARLGVSARCSMRLHMLRWRRCEAALPSWFSQVTTINGADTAEVVGLHGGTPNNVHTIPNGVNEVFLEPLPERTRRRGVAFWGNLHFPPNREAVRFFVESVYKPYLGARDVELCIVGREAPAWLLEAARQDPNITVKGFVDNLAEVVGEYPVMVNPMLIGSGLKNKVLEAFGLGLAVVSTSLGAEAFPDAMPGEHYVRADNPEAFAAGVLGLLDDTHRLQRMRGQARSLVETNYRWQVVGKRWNELCQRA